MEDIGVKVLFHLLILSILNPLKMVDQKLKSICELKNQKDL